MVFCTPFFLKCGKSLFQVSGLILVSVRVGRSHLSVKKRVSDASPPSRPQEEPTTWTGYFGKVLMASTSYLPSQVTEMFNQGRAFATVRLPFCGHKNICSLAT